MTIDHIYNEYKENRSGYPKSVSSFDVTTW